MAMYKNQHYVPKCYLKNFSSDEAAKKLNIFLPETSKIILNANLTDQCSKDYFYSKDSSVEHALSKLENKFSQTFSKLTANEGSMEAEDIAALRVSTVLQHIRTKGAVERSLGAVRFLKDFAPEAEWNDIQNNAPLGNLAELQYYVDSVSDLKCIIVRNSSKMPFVTSDDPVLVLNKFYDLRIEKFSGTGFLQSGLIVLFPLNREYLFMMYDKDIYSISNVLGSILDIKNDDKIYELNELQYLNSMSCVYIPPTQLESHIVKKFEEAKENRNLERVKISFGKEIGDTRNFKMETVDGKLPEHSGLIHSQSISLSPNTWPSMFQIRLTPKYHDTKSAAGLIRKGVQHLRSPKF